MGHWFKRYIPKTKTDWAAFLFMNGMIHIISLFELLLVIPTIYPVFSSGYFMLVGIGLYCYLNTMITMAFTIFTDTTSGSAVLPSVLKPGWRFCSSCEANAPPRSFHCWFCNICVLKRDHHCMFTGNCIGHHNMRYFLLLVWFLLIGASYCNFLNMDYTLEIIGELSLKSIFTMCLPLLSWVLGVSETFTFSVAFISMSCILGALLLVAFIGLHASNMLNGQTSYERSHRIKEYDCGWMENIRQTMGVNWYFAWLSPLIPSPMPGDGIEFMKKTAYEEPKNM